MVDTARARAEAALRRDATLEAVAFAAQRFLEEGNWEEVVPELLRRLGRATSASRAYVFQNHLGTDGTHLTSQRWEWVADGIAPLIDDPVLQSQSWVGSGLARWEKVLGGGNVLQGHVRDFPEGEHATLDRQQIMSVLVVPIFVSSEWWGHIGFDDCVTERVWTQIEIDALRTAAGTLGAAIHRHRTEEQLREAESKYRTLVEQIPAVTYIDSYPDPGADTWPTLYISPQIETLIGYSPQEWVANPTIWLSLLHPDDRDVALAADAHHYATGESLAQEYRMIARDGRVVWVRDEAVVVRDEYGTPKFAQGFLSDITERKLSEERIRALEKMYRLFVEQIPAVVYREMLNPDPARFYISPRLETIFGHKPADWARDSGFWESHIHPQDRERVIVENGRANESGEKFSSEYRFQRKDGGFAWVHDEATLVTDPGGGEPFWQGFILDVTERKLAEARLSEAQTRYQILVEHLPLVIYREPVRFDPKDFYISPQVESLFGYTAEEWRGELGFWHARIHPEDEERVWRMNQEANVTGRPYVVEYRFRKRDGRYVWIRDEAMRMEGTDGEEPFWQGFMIDITERKLAEERLGQAEEKFRLLVEQVPAAIYTQVIDEDDPALTNTVYMSPRIEDIIGYSFEETVANGGLWRDILHPGDRERVLQTDAAGNVTGEPWAMEYRAIAKDGRTVWIHDEAQAVLDEDGHPKSWQGFMLDISERKAAEEQLERALELEREASQRLRALDDMKNTFLQAVSHDLRTPLAAILGLAVTLEREDVELEAAEARDLARRIASNSRKLDRMVIDLLDLDRLARGIVEPKLHATDVGALVRRVVSDSDLMDEDRVHIEAVSIVASIDAAKVERIVENLLANTARHTPAGTRVWVRVEPAQGGVLVSVEDEGPGVPQDLREAVFEPFRQGPIPTHSPGVGVGLTLVARFAELMGGRAWVEDRDGGGASFRVFLAEGPPEDRG